MGTLRFLLASLVLASHLGHSIWGINPGVAAVVVFYLLAGNVVARLWRQRAQLTGRARVSWFYADRLWRIMPLYLLVAGASALLWWRGVDTPFLVRDPRPGDWLANVLVLPLNYYMYSGQDAFTLIPPAWSLAVELQYYLLAPLLLVLPGRWRHLLMLGSLTVYAFAQIGWLDADHYGYRLLPGVLFVFLAGACLADGASRRLLQCIWGGVALHLMVLLLWQPVVPYRIEVALGFVLGLPLLAWMMGLPVRSARGRLPLAHRVDGMLGRASYGVFLWHFPVIWALGLRPPALAVEQLLEVWLWCLVLSLLSHAVIEKPLWRRFRTT